MQLYHGGYCEIRQPEIMQGKYAKDFGEGFYCTELKEQAVRWAKRYDTAVVSTYHFALPDTHDLAVLDFKEMTEEWLDFIVSCRSSVKHSYDIVVGAMANDQVYNYVADYIEGVITREQFWVLAKFKHPTHQAAFCSAKALQYLTFTAAETISK